MAAAAAEPDSYEDYAKVVAEAKIEQHQHWYGMHLVDVTKGVISDVLPPWLAGEVASPLGATAAVNIERVDVRAFGAMAEELAERLDPQDEASVRLKPALDLLTARCMSPDVAARPSFAEIVDRLTSAGVECGLASRL